jgi:hypothetical protein
LSARLEQLEQQGIIKAVWEELAQGFLNPQKVAAVVVLLQTEIALQIQAAAVVMVMEV